MPTFTWVPDYGAKRTIKPRILQAKFGDGYSQDTRDGVNNLLEVWKLSFTRRTAAEVTAIDTFLMSAAGTSQFVWTTPRGVMFNFKCREWETDDSIPSDSSLLCTFEQVP